LDTQVCTSYLSLQYFLYVSSIVLTSIVT
jgi:hypothetical protein